MGNSLSSKVQLQVNLLKKNLQNGISYDVTSKMAEVIRRIDGRTNKALVTIRSLESQLKGAKKNKDQIENRLRDVIHKLFDDIANDSLDLKLKLTEPKDQPIIKKLPPYIQQCITVVKAVRAVRPVPGYTIGINPISTPQDILLPPPQIRPEIGQKNIGGAGIKWLYSW